MKTIFYLLLFAVEKMATLLIGYWILCWVRKLRQQVLLRQPLFSWWTIFHSICLGYCFGCWLLHSYGCKGHLFYDFIFPDFGVQTRQKKDKRAAHILTNRVNKWIDESVRIKEVHRENNRPSWDLSCCIIKRSCCPFPFFFFFCVISIFSIIRRKMFSLININYEIMHGEIDLDLFI